MAKLTAFLRDETGAVTVDWVVLTAAIVPLGFVIFTFIQPAVGNVATDIAAEIETAGSIMKSQ